MRLFSLALCLLIVGMAQAQTATPTATATIAPLNEGFYEAESLTAPYAAFVGTWAVDTATYAPATVITSMSTDASLSLQVVGRWLIVYRVVSTHTPSEWAWDVCIDAVCQAVTHEAPSLSIYQIGFDLGTDAQHSITLTNTGTEGDAIQIDRLIVMGQDPEIVIVPIVATPFATAVDMYDYIEVTAEVNGTPVSQVARVSYEVTAGDIMTNLMLMALFILGLFSFALGFLRRDDDRH